MSNFNNLDNSDGHLNRIGGKHNRFPTRGKRMSIGRPIGAFNVVSKGVFIFLCGAFGLTVVPQLFNMMNESSEIVQIAEDFQSMTSKTNTGDRASITDVGVELLKKRVKDECKLSEDKVISLLEYLQKGLENNNLSIEDSENILIMDVDKISSSKEFNKTVINKLEKYDSTVTFCFYCEAENEIERVKEIERINQLFLQNSEEIGKTGCVRAVLNVLTEYTENKNEFVFFATFIKM